MINAVANRKKIKRFVNAAVSPSMNARAKKTKNNLEI